MAKFPALKVEKRTLMGRKVKHLRRQGIIPANLFGNKIESIAIQVPEAVLVKLFKEVGETGIVEVQIDDKKYPSLIASYAKDAASGKLLHVDIHHVSLKEKVTAAIPLELVGESAAVKDLGGVLTQSFHEIEVEALPTELPESVQVDISALTALGDVITVADLKLPAGVAVQNDPEAVVVSVVEQQAEEVEEAAPAEVETTEQGATSEEAKATEEAAS